MKLFAAIIALSVVGLLGCSSQRGSQQTRDIRDAQLDPLVGQRVTLHGTLRSAGKFGPFVAVGGTAIYMKPAHADGIYHYSTVYGQLDGRTVEITGMLHFEHYPVVKYPPGVAAAVDHYWFEDETVQIRELASMR